MCLCCFFVPVLHSTEQGRLCCSLLLSLFYTFLCCTEQGHRCSLVPIPYCSVQYERGHWYCSLFLPHSVQCGTGTREQCDCVVVLFCCPRSVLRRTFRIYCQVFGQSKYGTITRSCKPVSVLIPKKWIRHDVAVVLQSLQSLPYLNAQPGKKTCPPVLPSCCYEHHHHICACITQSNQISLCVMM